MDLVQHLTQINENNGVRGVAEEVLRLYENTPASFRKPMFECIESTFRAGQVYGGEAVNPGASLAGVDMEYRIHVTPTVFDAMEAKRVEGNFFQKMSEAKYSFRKDQLEEFPVELSLGQFIKEVYLNAYEKHKITTFHFDKANVEFCKQHSENPIVPLMYIAGILTSDKQATTHHPVSTILAAIGLRLIYNHNLNVTFDIETINRNPIAPTWIEKDKLINRGLVLYGLK